MKLKRILSLLLAGLLLFSFTACRRPQETFASTLPLSDEEFYREPMLIVRASVINLKKEFFTHPDDDLHNAHVTTYDISISEIFKGSDGVELPFDAQVHLLNGEGLSEKQYQKIKNPFLLEVGKEYILGLSFPEEPYLELGGYVIENQHLWTFALNRDGLYENMDRGANHKTFDLITLKEKITALYHYEPENKPVVPLYTVDESIKDPTITAEQREQFFEFVQKWRVDAMYEFTPEKPMELELFKYYCAYFVTDEEKSYTDMGVNYTGAAIERIAKWFGTTYNLKDEELVFLKAGSLRDLPFAELIQYKEEKVDGKTLVTARCIQYSFPEYYYMDWSQVSQMESYAGHKRMILDGYVSSGYETYSVFDFSFYTEDGKTPTQFVAYNHYYPESFDKGFPLPDFIPGENAESNPKEPAETTPEPEVDPLPQVTVVRDETPELEKLASGVFYYGIKEFYPILNGKQIDFKELLDIDPQAVEKLLNQAKEDAKKEICTEAQKYDGGTTSYIYKDYRIVNFHASIPDIENPDNHEYLEGLVIGPPEMEYNTVYDMLMRDFMS